MVIYIAKTEEIVFKRPNQRLYVTLIYMSTVELSVYIISQTYWALSMSALKEWSTCKPEAEMNYCAKILIPTYLKNVKEIW